MINDNVIWADLNGGYGIPFDASIPLRELASTTDKNESDSIFKNLWDNLHHQGDVGLASYYSVPELINVCIEKNSFDWNFIGLCFEIEHCRRHQHNPQLPSELEGVYFNSLNQLESYLLQNFKEIKDETSIQLSLALFATLRGQIELGVVIANLDKGVIDELLDDYGWQISN